MDRWHISYPQEAGNKEQVFAMPDQPVISIIIPTHNRNRSLKRTLDSLALQTYPLQKIEVLVVTDGCTDDTVKVLREYQPPFDLHVQEQPWLGPAETRNCGARCARGKLLLFLDDDIEASPKLVEAHLEAHDLCPGHVVIGYLPLVDSRSNDFFHIELRNWWEAMFDAMRQPGHRFTYRDLLTGNFSIETESFRRVGGFNPAFRCHEDYELGVRLIDAGIPLIFSPAAVGYHFEITDLNRSLERKYQEGIADFLLGKTHPELRSVLPLTHMSKSHWPWNQLLRTLSLQCPKAARILIAGVNLFLRLMQAVRVRRYWRLSLDLLLASHYWFGVRENLSSVKALMKFLKDSSCHLEEMAPVLQIDLRRGLEVAEQELDERRPAGVVIYYGNQLVGRILPQPGSEPLRGNHLRPVLATKLSKPLAKALAAEGVLNLHVSFEHLMTACALDSVKPELFDVLA
jgi:GT2 family glycosyltransferase